MKLLLVEDSERLRDNLARGLRASGFTVDVAGDGVEANGYLAAYAYDFMVLDLGLPRLDGFGVLRALPAGGERPRVLVLSARDQVGDRVDALNAGADDYLVKPFEPRELEARIRALIRRERRQVSSEVYQIGGLVLDTATLRITRDGEELQVSPIGLKLLAILMRESPRVVSRHDIEREIWGDTLPDSDTLRSHLYNLRRVVDKPYAKPLVHTIHSAGYRVADLDAEAEASALASGR